MAKTIWRFPLNVDVPAKVKVAMPAGAKILHIESQFDIPCLWAEVDEGNPPQDHVVTVVYTGGAVPDDAGTYIGTALIAGGSIVLHLYDAVAS